MQFPVVQNPTSKTMISVLARTIPKAFGVRWGLISVEPIRAADQHARTERRVRHPRATVAVVDREARREARANFICGRRGGVEAAVQEGRVVCGVDGDGSACGRRLVASRSLALRDSFAALRAALAPVLPGLQADLRKL